MNAPKTRIRFALFVALATVLSSGGRAAPPVAAPAAGPVAPPAGGKAPTARVLVVNEQLLQDLLDIDRLAKRKMFTEAIEICQRMLTQPNLGLVSTEDTGLMMSAREAAGEKLAAMGPEGLDVYRTLYEPQARAMYERAMAAGDEEGLHELTWRYFHTQHGRKGLSALGSLHFDRGQFATAAFCWQRLLEVAADEASRAELLARLAAADHLGGEEPMAQKAADELKAKYPQARAVIGGREQNLVAFAAAVMALPRAGGAGGEGGWPGIGAVPGAAGIMADCPATLKRLWTEAGAATWAATQPSDRSLLAMGEWLRYMDRVALTDGQVRMDSNTPVPGMIHLVSAGGLVICRDDDGVSAMDATTGKVRWRTQIPLVQRVKDIGDAAVPGIAEPARKIQFPAHTDVVDGNKIDVPQTELDVTPRGPAPYYRGAFKYFRDTWQYAATVGEDKVFVAGGFLPQSRLLGPNANQMQGPAGPVADDSSLAAVSIAKQGMTVWRIGQGRGDDEVLRKGKFLGPPAYRDGRLYAVALYDGDYCLLCLSADDGALVWKSSGVPGGAPDVTARGVGEVTYPVGDWPAPPTLWGDRLFLNTAGVVSAYDAHTGDLAWAYQYPIWKESNASLRSPVDRARPHINVSPLVVSSARVLAMPSDSQVVFALSAATGRPLWLRDREGHMDLTAVDANTVVLSGFDPRERLRVADANEISDYKKTEAELMQEPQKNKALLEAIRRQMEPPRPPQIGTLMLLDAATGEPLYKAPADCLVVGRPAVTAKEVVASGLGKIYRLRLADRALTTVEVKDPAAILGNLVIVGGRLYAASACGIAAYGGK
jgi:outer membrane protein assembly factor BamB